MNDTFLKTNLKYLLFTFCILLLLSGCGSETDFSSGLEELSEDSYSVSITLSGAGTEETRGSGEDSEDFDGEYGLADENYIDIDDLYIMTFSIEGESKTLDDNSKLLQVLWDGKNKGTVSPDKSQFKSDLYFNGRTVYLHTWLDSKKDEYRPERGKEKNFCIVAIANFSQFKKNSGAFSLKNIKTFKDLYDTLKYNFSPQSTTNNWVWQPSSLSGNTKIQKGIPMFGVKRVNLNGYNSSVHNVANPYILKSESGPDLWMLRAFAKIEIKLSDELLKEEETKGPIIINSVFISNYRDVFSIIPELDRMSGFKGTPDKFGTGGTGQITKAPSLETLPSSDVKPLHFFIREDKKSAVAYLPEFKIENQDASISLSLKIGENEENHEEVFSFDLKSYGSTDENDRLFWKYLLPNHLYRFNISLNFNIISVTPKDWFQIYENNFEFGDGQVSSPVSPWDDSINNDYEL